MRVFSLEKPGGMEWAGSLLKPPRTWKRDEKHWVKVPEPKLAASGRA